MMRILLINPFYPISETPSPPLGLAYLGAALEQAGVEVKILDYVVHPYSRSELESAIKHFKPHLAGATAVTMTFDHARQVLVDLKTINPEILCVMGGPHVSFRARETLEETPELDVIVQGEGEQTVVDLMQAVKCARNLSGVTGIAFRQGSQIHTTPGRKFITNLDNLPLPARHLLPVRPLPGSGATGDADHQSGMPLSLYFLRGTQDGRG